MKSKNVLGLALLGVLSIPQAAMAFCDDCWFNAGLKTWFTTYKPGDGTSRSLGNPQISMTAGYDKFFFNFSLNGWAQYPNPNGTGEEVTHGAGGFNLGYIPVPELMLVVGAKNVEDAWEKVPAPYYSSMNPGSSRSGSTPMFTTIGASYSHTISDSPFSLNGGLTYGQRTLTVNQQANAGGFTGSAGGSSTYLGYDFGGSYAVTKSFKLSLYYRIEQWDAMRPTSFVAQPATYLANAEMVKMSSSGPGVGASYSF